MQRNESTTRTFRIATGLLAALVLCGTGSAWAARAAAQHGGQVRAEGAGGRQPRDTAKEGKQRKHKKKKRLQRRGIGQMHDRGGQVQDRGDASRHARLDATGHARLDATQRDGLRAAARSARGELQPLFDALRQLRDSARSRVAAGEDRAVVRRDARARVQELRAQYGPALAEHGRRARGLLRPEQDQRLEQLWRTRAERQGRPFDLQRAEARLGWRMARHGGGEGGRGAR